MCCEWRWEQFRSQAPNAVDWRGESLVCPFGRPTRRTAHQPGGGSRNQTLVTWLTKEARRLELSLRSSDEFGIPSSAKEAVAFAVMAYETWNRRPSNVPSATGAKRAVVLGKISFP